VKNHSVKKREEELLLSNLTAALLLADDLLAGLRRSGRSTNDRRTANAAWKSVMRSILRTRRA
jgi:hypothetical protein